MTGRRVSISPHLYEPGDYGQWEGRWYCKPPDEPNRLGNISAHQITEHDDGTITVSPSILIRGGGDDGEWHGFLEKGVWRKC